MIFHRTLWHLLLLLAVLLSAGATRSEPWQRVDPRKSGWAMSKLAIAEIKIQKLGAAGFVVIHDGRIAASWGNISQKVNVASVRKSLLSALIGIAVAEGNIRLQASLAELGIDDKAPALTHTERQAKVVDLLKARSGIYHPAAYETTVMTASRPERGSAMPGTRWHYNNWDFNALGTIYRKTTGEDIFASFGRRIAAPIGMEDFSVGGGRYVTEAISVHPAYPFLMSARDLARFGQLYLNGGMWEGKQVLSPNWVRDSLVSYSQTDRPDRGYGYMWWILDPVLFGPGAGLASGYGGQLLAIVPSKRLVISQTVDRQKTISTARTRDFLAIVKLLMTAAP